MAQAQPAIRTVRVRLTDTAIEPNVVQVPADYPIRFIVTNAGSNNHQLAFPHAQYAVDVLPGQTSQAVWTFVDVGEFDMCSLDDDDAQRGLKGRIIIETLTG
jgi:heme/copper-type cytochrome/quinol oxidase subunit 2